MWCHVTHVRLPTCKVEASSCQAVYKLNAHEDVLRVLKPGIITHSTNGALSLHHPPPSSPTSPSQRLEGSCGASRAWMHLPQRRCAASERLHQQRLGLVPPLHFPKQQPQVVY